MQIGSKVLWNGTQAEVLQVYKNGKCKISFWVQTPGMVYPELWKETVGCKYLVAA